MKGRVLNVVVAMVAVLVVAGLVLLLVLAPSEKPSARAPVSPNAPASGDLIEHPKTWDGQIIPFKGEAIGEAMLRGTYAWIHVNDDAYYLKNVEEGAGLGGYNSGMAIYLPSDLAEKIGTFGDYKHEGDIVEVLGTFNAACSQHGGDMDIHATRLAVIAPGRHAIDHVRLWKVALAIVLVVIALALWQVQQNVTASLERGAVTRSRA